MVKYFFPVLVGVAVGLAVVWAVGLTVGFAVGLDVAGAFVGVLAGTRVAACVGAKDSGVCETSSFVQPLTKHDPSSSKLLRNKQDNLRRYESFIETQSF